MSDTEGETNGEMALAFELDAIRQFEDPGTVFAEAREWSRAVGVVSNDIDAVASFMSEHDLAQDFDLGDRDIWLTMEHLRESHSAPRHVFVGTTPEDQRIADATGWEFRGPETVAERADWSLATSGRSAQSDPGRLERIRTWVSTLRSGGSNR